MFIQDPDLEFLPIPDPGDKKATEPGPATLNFLFAIWNKLWNFFVFCGQKLPWLKVDFDRLKNESDTEEEDKLLDKPDLTCQDILRTKVSRTSVVHQMIGNLKGQ
jgi:hypothetical protein